MVQEGTQDPRLRFLVGRLLNQARAPLRNDPAAVRVVQRFIQEKIRYLKEWPETYATPERTLRESVGDCDDQTILLCSAVRSIKIPARAAFAWWKESDGSAAGHVWSEVWLKPRWTAAETVKKVPLGWSPAEWLRSQGKVLDLRYVGDPEGRVVG
jgi:transglutaminase-like putative cysteine protease